MGRVHRTAAVGLVSKGHTNLPLAPPGRWHSYLLLEDHTLQVRAALVLGGCRLAARAPDRQQAEHAEGPPPQRAALLREKVL